MPVMVMTTSSPSPTGARHKRGSLLGIRKGHNFAVAICHRAAEGLAQKLVDVRSGVCSISGDFGDERVCEAAGVGFYNFNLDDVPAVHEVVVVCNDWPLSPRRGSGSHGRDGE